MLEIELIPSTAWGQNARTLLPSSDWDRLRHRVFVAAGHRCQVCNGVGSKHPVEGHEIWRWDESDAVQYLDGVVALCPWCHRCKHWGLTSKQGLEAQAMRHLARVNSWDPMQVIDHITQAKETWRRRSAITWTLDASGIHARLLEVTGRGCTVQPVAMLTNRGAGVAPCNSHVTGRRLGGPTRAPAASGEVPVSGTAKATSVRPKEDSPRRKAFVHGPRTASKPAVSA